uniref:Uncharacterized protein n=1 Tax=Arabidopsis halleri subsp. halleri TaxID=81971 RepID=I0J3C0_ARAHH|nr:unknown [Arabidopsis halleri subsp. halleri]
MSKDKSSSDGLISKLAATIVAALGPLCRRLTIPTNSPSPLRPSSSMASPSESQQPLEPRKSVHRSSRRRGGFLAGKRGCLIDKPIDYSDLSNPDHQALQPYLFDPSIESRSPSNPAVPSEQHPSSSTAQVVRDDEPQQENHWGFQGGGH